MAELNKVLLIGNLTRDPVSRATTGGTPICELGLATNRRYRTAAGQEGEDTCFVDIDVFGRLADTCARYLRKGSLVYVEGRLRLDQWEDRNTGDKRSRLKVVADRVQFLDRREDSGSGGPGYERAAGGSGGYDRGSRPAAPPPASPPPPSPPPAPAVGESAPPPTALPPEPPSPGELDEAVDDIPF